MNTSRPRPALFVKKGDALPLSGPVLTGLLAAVLARGVPFRFRAKGCSMWPFVRDGDVVTVCPLSSRCPSVGEVVALVRPPAAKLVIHRVISRRGAHYLTMGDSGRAANGLVPRVCIVGRVTRVERNGKEVFLGLGRERHLIAFLVRQRLLLPFISAVSKVIPPIIRRRLA